MLWERNTSVDDDGVVTSFEDLDGLKNHIASGTANANEHFGESDEFKQIVD